MKIKISNPLILAVGLGINSVASAATINFSTPGTVSVASDVFNAGGTVFAYTWGTSGTVNGVGFNSLSGSSGALGPNLTLASFNSVNAAASSAVNTAPVNTLPGSYSNILAGAVQDSAGNSIATVTLNGLVVGTTYAVQVWVDDSRSIAPQNQRREAIYGPGGAPSVTLAFNTAQAGGGVGQFTIGTFTADATSEVLTVDSSAYASSIAQINALQLREITGTWSGTTSSTWSETDSTSANFSGLSYSAVAALTTNLYFGDTDASGNAVATSTVAVAAGGVTGANANFNNNAVAYTVNSADAIGITGAYGVTLSGSGTVTFTGANTYTGNTAIYSGKLVLGSAGSVGDSAEIILEGGTLDSSALTSLTLASGQTLWGAGTVYGSITAAAGSAIIPGGGISNGHLTVNNNLTLNGQAITFDIVDGQNYSQIAVGSTLTLNGANTLSLNSVPSLIPGGTYTLMTFASRTGSGTLALNGSYPGITLNVSSTNVTITSANPSSTSGIWTNPVGGAWLTAANWANSIMATNTDGVADFSTLNITTSPKVTIGGVVTIGNLVFGGTGGNNWTLSTGTNILSVSTGLPQIVVDEGQNTTISASLNGTQGFTVSGGGELTLSGANHFSGPVNVFGSTLSISGGASLGSPSLSSTVPLTFSNGTWMVVGQTSTNNLIFAAGTTNTLIPTSGTVDPLQVGTTSGGGTVLINCNGGSPTGYHQWEQRGAMTNFSGTFIVTATGGNGGFLMGFNDDSSTGSGSGFSGSSNAIFEFNGGMENYLYNGAIAATNYMGALSGQALANNGTTRLTSKFGRPGNVTLEEGALGLSTSFDGFISDCDTPGANTTQVLLRIVGGSLTLSGSNTYTGATTVSNGTLVVSGQLANTPVTVKNTGTFNVTGTIASSSVTVNSGGDLVVGASAGLGGATLAVNGLMDVTASGVTGFNLGSSSLSGTGVVAGGLNLTSSTLNPGPVGAAGILTITNGSLTNSGGTLEFDLSNVTNTGNDLLVVYGNLDFSTPGVIIGINKINGQLGSGTYVLATCTGALTGSTANLTLEGADPADTLRFSGNQLQLVAIGGPSLTWTGDGINNYWDIGVSTDWLNGATPSTYADGAQVTFNAMGGANPTVNITATVTPAVVVVSGNSNYTFTGSAGITGGTTLVKSGSGTLTIVNNNTATGNIFNNGGTISIGNGIANGRVAAASFTNSAALVFNDASAQELTNIISGSGSLAVLGAGTLTLADGGNNTITGPTTVSANSTLSLGDGTSVNGSLGVGSLTLNSTSTLQLSEPSPFSMINVITNNGAIVNLSVSPVALAGPIVGSGSINNNTSSTLYLSSANSYTGGTYISQGTVFLDNFSGLGLGSVNLAVGDGDGTLSFLATAGTTNVVANNINLSANATEIFETPLSSRTDSAAVVRLTGVISGGASGQTSIFVDSGTALVNAVTVVLENANNTFSTIPEVYRGTLAFTSDGALGNANNGILVNAAQNGILTSPFWVGQGLQFAANNITLNANRQIQLEGNESIDVQAFAGTIAGPVVGSGLKKLGIGTLNLSGGGNLGAATTIENGTLVVNSSWTSSSMEATSGTTLMGTGPINAPIMIDSGATLSPGAPPATLSLGGYPLTLSSGSTTRMEINAGSSANSQVTGIGTLSYGGTLAVTNVAGTVTSGQTFQLFNASAYTGSFSATNLPTLGGGLGWSWTPASGTLAVVSMVATNPTSITAVLGSSTLVLSWPSDHTGWTLESQTNSLGTNWVTWPGSSSTDTVSVPITLTNKAVFFRLIYTEP